MTDVANGGVTARSNPEDITWVGAGSAIAADLLQVEYDDAASTEDVISGLQRLRLIVAQYFASLSE